MFSFFKKKNFLAINALEYIYETFFKQIFFYILKKKDKMQNLSSQNVNLAILKLMEITYDPKVMLAFYTSDTIYFREIYP